MDPKKIFEGSSVQFLEDRTVQLSIRNVPLRLAGCRFGLSPLTLGNPPVDTLNILLLHDPDYFEEASTVGYDLYLTGHTHGGQIRLPGYGAIALMSKRGYEAGLYSWDNSLMYVSRGLGAEGGPLPEVRLFCRPEVTILEVKGR
jgi:predicted MPP superfamily phosphohydrolase